MGIMKTIILLICGISFFNTKVFCATETGFQKTNLKLANLSEDVYLVLQELKRVSADHEQLMAQYTMLQNKIQTLDQFRLVYEADRKALVEKVNATLETIQKQLGCLSNETNKAYENYQAIVLKKVNEQIQNLTKQMQAGFDTLSLAIKKVEGNASQAIKATQKVVLEKVAPESVDFSENYPKDGIVYTVQIGDTLSKIAQAHASKVTYIQNANRIEDPKKIKVGEVLFVPQDCPVNKESSNAEKKVDQ